MARVERRPSRFDPAAHAESLAGLIDAIVAAGGAELDARGLDRLLRLHPRAGSELFARSEILAGFHALGGGARWPLDETAFARRLRLRPVRSLSGVTPVTLLTRPHPCPGRCLFCPNDLSMPKSYLAAEPGAQRAEDNRFDPYLQTWNRLAAYRAIGHPVDKVELIVLGGTWSFHPEPYQVWFALRMFEALNDFGAGVDRRAEALRTASAIGDFQTAERVDPAAPDYNRRIRDRLLRDRGMELLHASESADWAALDAAQRRNECAATRCIGLSFETRPDQVDAAEAQRLRRLGATKLQLGIQSLDDAVLAANRRGHDSAATRRAVALLRRHGFKLQAHYMVNLHGSDPARDLAGYRQLFADPALRPDELKLYPCSLVESAELMETWRRGEWQPYDEETLLDLLSDCLAATPRYCRVSRVIRDFSAGDIVAGSRRANLRESAEARLRARGERLQEIRSREIRGASCRVESVRSERSVFATSIGSEVFLETLGPDEALLGFARLALPAPPAPLPELEGCALLRELHVYGEALALGERSRGAAQHRGLGRGLVDAALTEAHAAGFERLAVISAVGTRDYYRRLGFEERGLYQIRSIR